MWKDNLKMEKNDRTEKKPVNRDLLRFTILVPLLIYMFLAFGTTFVARSDATIMIGSRVLPLSTLAGVFSSLSNLCLVVMVLFYKKIGFVLSIVLLIIQFPGYIAGLFRNDRLTSLPGLFIGLFGVVMMVLIYNNHVRMEREQKRLQDLFEQTATALVNAIDAKDIYTRGHSLRVANYSKKLAEMSHKSEEECQEIYYAALLHDVGKIGIPIAILSKNGKLTHEEYKRIQDHPVLGEQILASIKEFPYLSKGAGGHHERYDGKGYPNGLKGEEIPELARIISVADAYDAMTSKRSYRDPIPQQKVREELVKGTGTQFDPKYARLMIHLIDVDTEYEMREREEGGKLAGDNELVIDEYRSTVSGGVLLTAFMTTLRLKVTGDELIPGVVSVPSLIMFDSLDGHVHDTEKEIKDLNYYEYCELWFDGKTEATGARKIRTEIREGVNEGITDDREYVIEAVRIEDHALIRILSRKQTIENVIALPDSSRFAHIGFTGEHCRISKVSTVKAQDESPAGLIPRIAEKVSFISGPVGDVPNVQIDGYRLASSEGVEIKDGLEISFHTRNLPSATLVWHCPFIEIFTSDDGKVRGKNYRDLAFMRFDGEGWECDPACTVELDVSQNGNFTDWDAWKKLNMDGYDTVVTFKVKGNRITVVTENGGVAVSFTAILTGVGGKVYTAVTGDQVALTNVRIK